MSEVPFKKERNVSLCKICQELVLKITDHKYSEKNFRYVDDKGKFWNGRTCPDCHKKAMRARMKTLRTAKPINEQT